MKKKTKKYLAIVFIYFISIFSVYSLELTATQLYEKGLVEQNKDNYYLASEFYMEAVKKNPVYFQAWVQLATCTYQLGEYDLALSYILNAEKFNLQDSYLQNLKGMCYLSLREYKNAEDVFNNVLKIYPNDVNARFGLAELDLLNGKISGAENKYLQALKREFSNRKALLSLAILALQNKNTALSDNYINQALRLYSGDENVHYVASILDLMKNNYSNAEKRIRIAIEIDPDFTKGYELLAKILFEQNKYNEAIDVCDYLLNKNRNNNLIWYIKGFSLLEKGDVENAINTWSTGLEIFEHDEIMRVALETAVNKNLPLEDPRRKTWANYHIQTAKNAERRFDSSSITYEYQRALKIDPTNVEARLAFAQMLKLNNFNELYLEQLNFITTLNEESNNSELKNIQDIIEGYDSLLQNTVAKKWNVQPFYLDKVRWNLGIYYIDDNFSSYHVENNRIAADLISDVFAGINDTSVSTTVKKVENFGEAFREARKNKLDYFFIINIDEGSRDINFSSSMYSARTGILLKESNFYNTGNNKFSSSIRRFKNDIFSVLPIKAKIINRNGKTLLVDIGKSERIVNGAVFDIVKKDSILTASNSLGVVYQNQDILGSLTITNASEEISEGELEYKGFYDRINTLDEVVLIKNGVIQEVENQSITENTPSADVNGNSINAVTNIAEELGLQRIPSYVDLIRSIN